MKYYEIGIKAVAALMICGVLQSCYVQKGTEVHATVIHEQYPVDNAFDEVQYVEVVTVEENLEPSRSLEALSTNLLLIDIENKKKVTRWEDNLSYSYNSESKTSRWGEKTETFPTVIVNN
ncbi:MAG: hypothetical protein RLO17_26400 [Cyclobacteriaceae bacterium]